MKIQKSHLPIHAAKTMRRRWIDLGALNVNDHFVYSGGGHSDEFFDFEALLPLFSEMVFFYHNLCDEIVRVRQIDVDTVIGPERGGIPLAQMMAFVISKSHVKVTSHHDCRWIYAEKIRNLKDQVSGRYRIPKAFERYIANQTILAVDDVANTGGNLAEVIALSRRFGAKRIISAVMIDRFGLTAEAVGADENISVVYMKNKVWQPDECPKCQKLLPVNTEFGHGKEFVVLKTGN